MSGKLMGSERMEKLFKEFMYSDFMDAVISDRMLISIKDSYNSLDLVVNLLKSGKGQERHYREFEELLDDIDALEVVYVYYSGDYAYKSRLEEYEHLGDIL
jgi:hypothetical protein